MKIALSKTIFVGYGLLVTLASMLPASQIHLTANDKLGHCILYAVFALLAFPVTKTTKSYFLLCIGIVTYSGFLEIGQGFIPGRTPSGLDLLANGIGALLGASLGSSGWIPGLRQSDTR